MLVASPYLIELRYRALEILLRKIGDEVPYLPEEGRREHVSSRTLARLEGTRAPTDSHGQKNTAESDVKLKGDTSR